MTPILTRRVPAWTLILAVAIALLSLSTAWLHARERAVLEDYIRMQEDRVPGFLERTSILSDEARCRRSVFVGMKDYLTGADSCASEF